MYTLEIIVIISLINKKKNNKTKLLIFVKTNFADMYIMYYQFF